jgi:phage terminase large subunit-like protein
VNLDAALDLIRDEMTLPDGTRLGSVLFYDPWIVDNVLTPVLETDDAGLPAHPLSYIELSRGHAKTTLAALVSMVEALRGDGTQVYALASDQEQAGLLGQAIQGQLRRNAKLARLFKPTKLEYRVPSTNSFIRIMSSDLPSFFGVGVDARRLRFICDELGQWLSRELFDAALTTLPKSPDAALTIISNAGVRGTWQEEVRFNAEAQGWHVYSVPGVIASWIKPADLARIRATVPAPVYARYYENQWVEPQGEFVSLEEWDSCRRLDIPRLDERTPVVIGCDAAISGDCWAAVVVSRDATRPADAVWVRDVGIWRPEGGSIDFELPWRWLSAHCQAHNTVQVCYDPFQLHDFMTRFSREHAVWTLPFEQGQPRAQSDSDLFALIRTRRVGHNGDPGLREHIANCGLKMAVHEDSKARLVKRGKGKIDAAVALSMGASECLRLNI